MLAAVITADNIENAARDIKNAGDADLVELRLDYIKKLDMGKIKKIAKASKKEFIITCRKRSEGGLFGRTEAKRIEILKNSMGFADYIDIEHSSGKDVVNELLQSKKNAKIIVSYHNLKETPDNISAIYKNIKKLNPDIIKIATNANSVTDNFKIFDLIKTANKDKKRIIAFCMGSYGQFSRVAGSVFGSEIAYASIAKGKESAIGQLTMDELNNIYRIKKLNKNTKIAGLIGNPVGHSWSDVMHNASFEALNINAVYLKFKVDRLKEFIEYFKKLRIMGFSVTIPHKIEVMKYLDKVDEKAKSIGAVNTVVAKNDKLIGHNTDCDGSIKALKSKTSLNKKNAVILGAGGSARALAYGLIENGANVTVLNRAIEKAKSIADDFECNYGSLSDLKDTEYDILVNTTPVGMYPDIGASPIPKKMIKKGSVVFDIVFNPHKTKLLEYAEKNGCTIIHGIEMLVYGNALQFELWTGKNAPIQLMRKKVMSYLKNAGNKN